MLSSCRLVKEHDAVSILPPFAVGPGEFVQLLLRRLLPMPFETLLLRHAMTREVLRVVVVVVITAPIPVQVEERGGAVASCATRRGKGVAQV